MSSTFSEVGTATQADCLDSVSSIMPTDYREPLCLLQVLPSVVCRPAANQRALPRLHRSYRPMRQTKNPLPAFMYMQVIFAGCSESLLEDGPSRLYLCNPFTGAWTPTPQRLFGALFPFLPEELRPHHRSNQFGTPNIPLKATSVRGI
ncbi:hypothetical protein ES705_41632 [subsurface metagenome]